MFANITVVGNLGQDPETKSSKSGTSFTKFSVATKSYKGKDDSGASQYETIWFGVTVFGQRGEYISKYAKKGDVVAASGEFSTRMHEGKAYFDITASDVKIVHSKEGSQNQPKSASAGATTTTATVDEDVPF